MKNQVLFSSKDKSKKLNVVCGNFCLALSGLKYLKTLTLTLYVVKSNYFDPHFSLMSTFFFFCSRQNFFKSNQFIHTLKYLKF